MLSCLNNLDTTELEIYLTNSSIDENKLLDVLKQSLSRPELLIIRGAGRDERDYFFNRLLEIFVNEYSEIYNFVLSKHVLIKSSEDMFDRLSKVLEECEISKQLKDVQAWSHIERVESEYHNLRAEVDSHLKIKPKKEICLSHFSTIKNSEGREFSPDAASEHLITYLSMTLKLLAYKYKWFSGEHIVIPKPVDVSEENLFQAGSIELFARSWKELEHISQRGLLFGGSVTALTGEQVQDDAKQGGVKESYHFDRNESRYELYDAIACERLKRKSLQNFMELISNKYVRQAVADSIENVGRIEQASFLCEDEVLACQTIGDVFCVSVFEDKQKYHGLTLAEWIRCYFTIQYISKQIVQKKQHSVVDENYLLETFDMAGIEKDKTLLFISLISFSRNASDLFDCPLIKIEGDLYYLSYSSCLHFNVSNLILSRFSSIETDSSDKGYKFEAATVDLITKQIGCCKSFKFKRESEEYEYDAVFILDKRIFILECKNRSLSWYNPVKAYRNKKYLGDTIKQVHRLKNALIKHPEVIQEHFGVDCGNFEIVPVIFNCMPFSWIGKIDGVYISDFSAFSRLLKSSKIHFVSSGLDGQTEEESSYKLWRGTKICSQDIVNFFDKPVQILPYLGARKKEQRWWVADNEVAFTVTNFEIDHKLYQNEEKKLFKVRSKPDLKAIKKVNRKKMAKKSRKRNRRN